MTSFVVFPPGVPDRIVYTPGGVGGSPGAKGDPGGNIMAIGLFTAASTLSIPTGTNAVRTSGYSTVGIGIADYLYDAAVDSAYVAAHPHSSFISSNSRGFRIALGWAAHLAQFGVTDGADAYAAAQEAINLLGAKGGFIGVSPITHLLSAGLVANAPVLFYCPNLGDTSTSTNGSGATNTRPVFYWTGSSGGTMLKLSPSSTGTAIFGGGSDGIFWDGNSSAAIGVAFDNCIASLFDGSVSRVTTAGVDISSASGSTTNFTQRIRVRRLHFIWGTAAACQPAHGLRIRGNGVDVPGTQHELGEISGLVYNGNLVDIAETDNMRGKKIHGVVQSGGTGKSIYFHSGGAQNASFNVFEYVVGPLGGDANCGGNHIKHYISEGGGISMAGKWHGSLMDYGTAALYESHRYQLQKKINIGAGLFVGDGASGVGDIASTWRTITLVDTTTSSASAVIPDDFDLENGTITGVEVFVASAGTSGGNYRMRIRFSTEALDTTSRVVTPWVDDTSTYAAGAQNQVHKLTLTFGTPVAFAKGNTLFLRVGRLGQDALDTNTDALHLVGARLLYKSTGPRTAGSGTYTIPDW